MKTTQKSGKQETGAVRGTAVIISGGQESFLL
jgi:hypothetical protein